jgi:DNA-binding beta-propeller fold protein YncE
MKNKFKGLRFGFSVLLFFVLGCATAPKIAQEGERPVFYPPLPDEPRLQFLTSFSTSEDLESPTSEFRKFVVGEEKNFKAIVKPYGVAAYNDKIYVCDAVHNSIDILDLKEKKFETFRPKEDGRLIGPLNLSFDANGNMYVADPGRGQVVIFDKSGSYSVAIGNKSEFKPVDVLVRDDKIYICDLKSQSVKVYGLIDKRYLFSVPKESVKEEAKLFSPTNIAIDEEGNLYVSDSGASKVQKYNADGEFQMSIGSQGDSPGEFARPKGIAVDKEGRVYVVDAAFENVQIFDKNGKLLLFFAEPGGSRASLVLPAGIAIDYSLKDFFSPLVDPAFEAEYLVLVTSQYGDRKLSLFAFGHKRQ